MSMQFDCPRLPCSALVLRRCLATCLSLLCFPAAGLAAETSVSSPSAIDFVRDVQPILQSRCISCHGPEKQKADLRFDIKSMALKGSENGAVIKRGDGAASAIIKRVSSNDPDARMPPKG